MKMFDSISARDRRVLAVLQKGFPNTRTPFEDMAGGAGMDTCHFLGLLRDWKSSGKIRRVGAIVDHFKLGLNAGAMVAWQVEPERTEQTGLIMAGFNEVSHVYEREAAENWRYNLYTMVHGASRCHVEEVVKRMSQTAGISSYKILFTELELKKVSPTYIMRDCQDK